MTAENTHINGFPGQESVQRKWNYLQDVPLGQMKGSGRYVDSFPSLHLDTVDALVVVVVVHGVIWRQENPFIVEDR